MHHGVYYPIILCMDVKERHLLGSLWRTVDSRGGEPVKMHPQLWCVLTKLYTKASCTSFWLSLGSFKNCYGLLNPEKGDSLLPN